MALSHGMDKEYDEVFDKIDNVFEHRSYDEAVNDCTILYEEGLRSQSKEEKIELLKSSFCWPKEFGLRAFIDKEESRFVDLLADDNIYGLSFEQCCMRSGFQFDKLHNMCANVHHESIVHAKAIANAFLDTNRDNIKRSIFWFLIASRGDIYRSCCPIRERYLFDQLRK